MHPISDTYPAIYKTGESARNYLDKDIDAAVIRRNIPAVLKSIIDYQENAMAWVKKATEREQELRKLYGYHIDVKLDGEWTGYCENVWWERYTVRVIIAPLDANGQVTLKFAGQSNYAYEQFEKNKFSKMLKFVSQLSTELSDAPVVFIDVKRKIPASFKPKILFNGTQSDHFSLLLQLAGKKPLVDYL